MIKRKYSSNSFAPVDFPFTFRKTFQIMIITAKIQKELFRETLEEHKHVDKFYVHLICKLNTEHEMKDEFC